MFDRTHTFMLAALRTGLRRADILLKGERKGTGFGKLTKQRNRCGGAVETPPTLQIWPSNLSAVVLLNTFAPSLARCDTA